MIFCKPYNPNSTPYQSTVVLIKIAMNIATCTPFHFQSPSNYISANDIGVPTPGESVTAERAGAVDGSSRIPPPEAVSVEGLDLNVGTDNGFAHVHFWFGRRAKWGGFRVNKVSCNIKHEHTIQPPLSSPVSILP